MMVHMHPQTALVSHSFTAYLAIQIYGVVLMFIPHMNFEIVPVDEFPTAEWTEDMTFVWSIWN